MVPALYSALAEFVQSTQPQMERMELCLRGQSQWRGELLTIMIAALLASILPCAAQTAAMSSPIQTEILIQSTSSWDGTPYISYPAGRPEVTILKITIAPHTTMKWHSHPLPIAGYILSGELTIEKEDGTKQHSWPGKRSQRQ